jgi:hypothetical protein
MSPLGPRDGASALTVFRGADIVGVDELRAAREAALVRDDDGEEAHRAASGRVLRAIAGQPVVRY